MSILDVLPAVIEEPLYSDSWKIIKNNRYYLIIFSYKNDISYRKMKISKSGGLLLLDKLIEFYDDDSNFGLENNIKRMYDYLVSEGYLN